MFVPELDAIWREADTAMLRCLELAHESFLSRGLPVGSVIGTGDGEEIGEGRNRVYDPSGGPDRLQRTSIAHAEMNALASVDTTTDSSSLTLWSSHRPCLMCAAACEFTGVGSVVFIAPDPSDAAVVRDPDGIDPEWVVVVNLLFLSGVAARSGPPSPTIARARWREPEVVALMGTDADTALRQQPLRAALIPLWTGITTAAQERLNHHGRGVGPSRSV